MNALRNLIIAVSTLIFATLFAGLGLDSAYEPGPQNIGTMMMIGASMAAAFILISTMMAVLVHALFEDIKNGNL